MCGKYIQALSLASPKTIENEIIIKTKSKFGYLRFGQQVPNNERNSSVTVWLPTR